MKELNTTKKYRRGVINLSRFKQDNDAESMFRIIRNRPYECAVTVIELSNSIHDLCEDYDTLEAEVERLREENETLKKQMEDDLK